MIASGELNDPAELTQLTEQAKRCQVTLLCPGQAISMRKVTIPNSGKRHLDKLIPYALEDELADDIACILLGRKTALKKARSPSRLSVIVKCSSGSNG